MNSIRIFMDAINEGMNYLVSGMCLILLLFLVIRYTAGKIRKYREGSKKGKEKHPLAKGLFLGTLALVQTSVLVLVVGFFPELMEHVSGHPAYVFRWVLLFLVIPPLFMLMTCKYSRIRGYISPAIFLTIALVGWLYERWVGFLLISVPMYSILWILIHHLAQVVIPVNDPDNKSERWNRFKVFLWYLVGAQYTFWVPKDSVSRQIEKRINGASDMGVFEPGTVWSHSHQVMGISTGSEFINVEGPGVTFTKANHRPIALTDLRKQIRKAELDTTTKDGVPIEAIVFTSFKIDNEDWPKKGWKTKDRNQLAEDIKANPLLLEGIKIDRKIGVYPYSTARVKSVLSTVGINTTPPHDEEDVTVYWDEWVLMQIQNAARQVISQRNLDQMWKPIDSTPGASALDEMADQIVEIVNQPLRRVGIHLFGARIVDFSIKKDSPIAKRQIDSWKSLWSQKIAATEAEAEAVDKEEIEKAHAYAKSAILGAIADSIQKAGKENKNLPRHVIAVYFIHAIE
jgi:hypothetical protein